MSEWIYKGKPIFEIPEGMFGFVYNITNTKTGRQYIGKKQFISKRSKKVVGKKHRSHFIKPSDWQTYWGSCEELLNDISKLGEISFVREIIQLCPTKRDLTFGEIEHQIKNDVLTALLPDGSRKYYNGNIMSRWFVCKDSVSEETRQRMSKTRKEIWKDPEYKNKQKEKSISKETKEKHSK
jgi:Putative endonuclease segE, GIY-YIG domain